MKDQEQIERYEYAKKRVRQKKRVYYHFVFFCITSIFLYVLNRVFLVGEPYRWYQWVVLLWFFLWVVHIVQVFIMTPFMGEAWERKQLEKLMLKQELKLTKMERDLEKEARLKAESEQYAEEIKAQNEELNSKDETEK